MGLENAFLRFHLGKLVKREEDCGKEDLQISKM